MEWDKGLALGSKLGYLDQPNGHLADVRAEKADLPRMKEVLDRSKTTWGELVGDH